MAMKEAPVDHDDLLGFPHPPGNGGSGNREHLSVAASPVGFFLGHHVGGQAGDLPANAGAFTRDDRDPPFTYILLTPLLPDGAGTCCTLDGD